VWKCNPELLLHTDFSVKGVVHVADTNLCDDSIILEFRPVISGSLSNGVAMG
jgi:hypothetical protein